MPMPRQEVDATTPKYLRDKYAIAGVGETTYTRGSGKTTRALGTWAVRNAILDAGLKSADIDGILSYSGGDSTSGTFIAGDLGIRVNYYMDVVGGGSSTEALIGMAIGLIEAGCCKMVAIFRSMNGYSQVRIGGTGARSAAPVGGDMLHNRAYGWQSAGQSFAPTFMRHMYDYGTRPEQVAAVKVAHSHHASNNPKAYYKKRYTIDDVLSSRFICKPLHLLDCCVETNNATCVIVTSAKRARDMKQPLVLIRGVVGRCSKPRLDMHYQHGRSRPSPAITPRASCGPMPGSGPRISTSPAPTTPLPLRQCCNSKITASAKRARAASMCRAGDPARRPAAEQHQRRASVRGLHPRYEHGHRKHPPTAPRRRRFLPRSGPTASAGTLLITARAAAARSRMSRSAPISAGPTRRPHRRWSCGAVGKSSSFPRKQEIQQDASALALAPRFRGGDAKGANEGEERCQLRGEYMGMALTIDDIDVKNLEYFRRCADGDFHCRPARNAAGCAIHRPLPAHGA